MKLWITFYINFFTEVSEKKILKADSSLQTVFMGILRNFSHRESSVSIIIRKETSFSEAVGTSSLGTNTWKTYTTC